MVLVAMQDLGVEVVVESLRRFGLLGLGFGVVVVVGVVVVGEL